MSLVVASSVSHAATVQREDPAAVPGRLGTGTLVFQARPGERNRVTVSTTAAREYRFEDRGAGLTAGSGCRSTPDVHVVLCPEDRGFFCLPDEVCRRRGGLNAFLGDRDDTFRFSGVRLDSDSREAELSVDGESGDDKLLGGPLNDVLGGGAGDDSALGGRGADSVSGDVGNDRLAGGGGRDELVGGDGNDRLSGGPQGDQLYGDRGSDLLRGGQGLDVARYFPKSREEIGRVFRMAPRRPGPRLGTTLDGRSNDGRRNERDNVLPGIERAWSQTEASHCLPSYPVGAGPLLLSRHACIPVVAARYRRG